MTSGGSRMRTLMASPTIATRVQRRTAPPASSSAASTPAWRTRRSPTAARSTTRSRRSSPARRTTADSSAALRTCSTAWLLKGRLRTPKKIAFSRRRRTPSNISQGGTRTCPRPFTSCRAAGGASRSLTVRSTRGPVDGGSCSSRRRLSRRQSEARLRLRPVPAAPPGRTADVANAETTAIRLRAHARRRAGPARRRQAGLSPSPGVRRIDDVPLLRLFLPDEPDDRPRLLRRRHLGGDHLHSVHGGRRRHLARRRAPGDADRHLTIAQSCTPSHSPGRQVRGGAAAAPRQGGGGDGEGGGARTGGELSLQPQAASSSLKPRYSRAIWLHERRGRGF